MSAYFRDAFRAYQEIIMFGALYIAVVVAEAVFCGVTLPEFFRVGYAVLLLVVKCVIFLTALAGFTYLKGLFQTPDAGKSRFGHAQGRLAVLQKSYFEGEVFAQGCVGLLAIFAIVFYFIQKSLIAYVHPFAWDDVFIALDRKLHFGTLPNEFVVPIVEKFQLGGLLDIAYFFWFAVMYAGLAYNLFWDNDRKRRLRFMWVFMFSWILLGSLMGVIFSAAGPVFYHDFFPNTADPYKDFVAYIDAHGPTEFPIAYHSRFLLLGWTTNGKMVNPNAVAAFPSLHLAIAWLMVLYGWNIRRGLGIAAVVFAVLIYFSTILFGYHYAIDGYVSVILVSLLWWLMGKYLNRFYPPSTPLLRRI